MRDFRLSLVALLAGLSLACPGELATPADTDTPGSSTGGASNSDTGANSSPTGTATPTTGEPGESTDIGVGSTTNIDPGDTGSSGDSSSASSSSSTGAGEASSSTGDAPVCGDGQLDPGEACDDANAVENDGCFVTCEFGPGAVIDEKELPPLANIDALTCFTAIDDLQLSGDGHALVFGSIVIPAGPDGEAAARVQQRRLPELAAPEWTYLEWAGYYGRFPNRMVTAANGDVIVAGEVYTGVVQPDSNSYLWLARFTPGGEVVWTEEYEEHEISPGRLVLAPDGDIVLVGSTLSFGGHSTTALRFHDDGQLVWKHDGPWLQSFYRAYTGLTLDDDGNIYLLVSHQAQEGEESGMLLEALTGDGTPLWMKLYPQPDAVRIAPGDLVWTADDRLVVSVNRIDPETLRTKDQFALAAFDTAGEMLWWTLWGTGEANGLRATRLVARDDGGFYALGRQIELGKTENDTKAALATRFDASGELVWSHLRPGGEIRDALRGPDGLLYVLSKDAVLVHLP